MAQLNPGPVVLPAATITLRTTDPLSMVYNAQPGIRNTDTVGVLIDKINVVFVSTLNPPALRLQLKWRNETITNGYVMLPAVAWPNNMNTERRLSTTINLDRPMYLPPGEYIGVSVINDFSTIAGSDLVVHIGAVGIQSVLPDERWLPYLTSYTGPAYVLNDASAISDQSALPDLGNPFDVPLFVGRMIGRVLVQTVGGSLRDAGLQQYWAQFLMRISDHKDNYWVAQPTPLPLVFNTVDRSWLLNHTMEPKGFLRVDFEGTNNWTATATARAVVGLVGYRRIA